MFRIAGVDLPRNKQMEVALTYIYGIGKPTAQKILRQVGIEFDKKTNELSEEEILKLRKTVDTYSVEGSLKRKIASDIRRLTVARCYRGTRHQKKLPVRGQRTHSNARTRKGRAVAIAGKKSIKALK